MSPNAITSWASDATDLLIYMTGHGGDKTFRMGETEFLLATDLDSWLDELQCTLPGKVVIVFDGCQTGSFLPFLTPPSGKERILITSASEGEYAYFTSMGSLSFSYIFWSHIFNGMNVDDAFILAQNAVSYTYSHQTPQLDDNGNGIGNEDADGVLSKATIIGNGVMSSGEVPVIGDVSPDQTLNGEQ
ncbi:MAG: C13 family peptidase [Thermodesulfobacteriota bacterium]|nr:C13 family peptidase [Thermodesulfobacteriota bacterium]